VAFTIRRVLRGFNGRGAIMGLPGCIAREFLSPSSTSNDFIQAFDDLVQFFP